VNVPWNLALCIVVGAFLMCSRLALGTEAPLAHSDHLIGALLITIAVTAFAEIARPVRFLNVILGAGLMAAPLLLDGGSAVGSAIVAALGLVVIAVSIPRGRIRYAYGTANRKLI
jgi:hypothetical protein